MRFLNLSNVIYVYLNAQVPAASSHSCPVSGKTVKAVKKCPEIKTEWMESAVDMNCNAYASECDEPDKLKYHCIINASGGLVEVCAYAQKILRG